MFCPTSLQKKEETGLLKEKKKKERRRSTSREVSERWMNPYRSVLQWRSNYGEKKNNKQTKPDCSGSQSQQLNRLDLTSTVCVIINLRRSGAAKFRLEWWEKQLNICTSAFRFLCLILLGMTKMGAQGHRGSKIPQRSSSNARLTFASSRPWTLGFFAETKLRTNSKVGSWNEGHFRLNLWRCWYWWRQPPVSW